MVNSQQIFKNINFRVEFVAVSESDFLLFGATDCNNL